MTNEITENKNTDTVAQAREALERRIQWVWQAIVLPDETRNQIDALITAVRAECADRRITMTDAETFTLMARCRCGLPQVCANGLGCSYHAAPAPTDTVAQVRERLVLTFGGEGYTSLPEVEAELDALIAAVRAESADRVRGLRGGYRVTLEEAIAALEAK